MTDLTEVALATRKYYMDCSLHTGVQTCFIVDGASQKVALGPIMYSSVKAQAACDRLNLLAVLEALREPSEGMVAAAEKACGLWEGFLAEKGWNVMIDKLIAEVKAAG